MTDYKKKRIPLMQKQNAGYAMIAKELLGSVKQFCRRNGLQSGDLEAGTQPEKVSETTPAVDLISTENSGNSTTASRSGSSESTGHPENQPVCEITVSYAGTADSNHYRDLMPPA